MKRYLGAAAVLGLLGGFFAPAPASAATIGPARGISQTITDQSALVENVEFFMDNGRRRWREPPRRYRRPPPPPRRYYHRDDRRDYRR